MKAHSIIKLAMLASIVSSTATIAQTRDRSAEERAAVRAEAQRAIREQRQTTQPMFEPNRVGAQSVPTTTNGNGTTVVRNR